MALKLSDYVAFSNRFFPRPKDELEREWKEMSDEQKAKFHARSTLIYAKEYKSTLTRIASHRFPPVTDATTDGDAAVVGRKHDATNHLHVTLSVSTHGALSMDLGVGTSSVSRGEFKQMCEKKGWHDVAKFIDERLNDLLTALAKEIPELLITNWESGTPQHDRQVLLAALQEFAPEWAGDDFHPVRSKADLDTDKRRGPAPGRSNSAWFRRCR